MKAKIILTVATSLLIAIGTVGAETLPKTHLNVIGTWSNLPQYKNFEQPFWTKEIPEKSGGAVTADIKGLNEMGLKGGEIGRLLKQGVIDIGSMTLGYMAGDDPRNEVVDLAGLSPDIETARKVANAYSPVLAALYKKKYNIKMLGMWPNSAQVIFCKTPIKGLADLKGKKVRTANRSLSDFIGALGGTGVTLAFAEVVQALQTGVVDCAITGTLSAYAAKWYEVSNYMYALPVGWSVIMYGANEDRWSKLDPRVQKFLADEIKSLEDRIWISSAKETVAGIACNTGKGQCKYGEPAHMTLVEVSDADKALLHKVLENVVVKKWVERCGSGCAKEFNDTVGQVVSVKAAG